MAGYLHLPQPPLYAKLGSGYTELAVTRLHAPNGFSEPTRSIPTEKAFSIHLHLRATKGGKLWLGGKLVPTPRRPSGGVTILDLEEDPVAFFPNPIDVVQFYLPRVALEEFAYQNRLAVTQKLNWPHCDMDAVLKHLGLTVLIAMQRRELPPRLFLDHVALAVLAHAAYVYGGIRVQNPSDKGCLAPWQARHAKAMLMANLNGDVTIAELSAECGLSISHFARSFRLTFGMPPHRWLMEQRVAKVKSHLKSRVPLAEIADMCGFSDQAAMSRSFKRIVGDSPGEWRRSKRGQR
jgi:AraC-like DNA-binding protein